MFHNVSIHLLCDFILSKYVSFFLPCFCHLNKTYYGKWKMSTTTQTQQNHSQKNCFLLFFIFKCIILDTTDGVKKKTAFIWVLNIYPGPSNSLAVSSFLLHCFLFVGESGAVADFCSVTDSQRFSFRAIMQADEGKGGAVCSLTGCSCSVDDCVTAVK